MFLTSDDEGGPAFHCTVDKLGKLDLAVLYLSTMSLASAVRDWIETW